MDALVVPGIIVLTIVFLVLRPAPDPARALSSWVVVGLIALFFALGFALLGVFLFLPPFSEWLAGFREQSNPFGPFVMAVVLSVPVSLTLVLALAFALKRRRRTSSTRNAGRSRP